MEAVKSQKNGGLGIIRQLGDLPPEAVVSEEGLAKMLGKCRISIKRAVQRGELPLPVRMFGESVWTVQALRDHLNHRLDEAKKDRERSQRRISALTA